MTKFLYAAYCATWVIHIVYVISLSRRATRLRQQWDEFRRGR